MTIQKLFSTEEDMHAFAIPFAKAIADGACVFLSGELGTGKTTFTRGILRAVGFNGKVKSPTYTLVEPYDINHKKIFHFDLYRLESPEELLQIGITDYLSPENICLIEWPDKGAPYLPTPDLDCQFEFHENGRLLFVTAKSPRGEEMLALVSK